MSEEHLARYRRLRGLADEAMALGHEESAFAYNNAAGLALCDAQEAMGQDASTFRALYALAAELYEAPHDHA